MLIDQLNLLTLKGQVDFTHAIWDEKVHQMLIMTFTAGLDDIYEEIKSRHFLRLSRSQML